MCRCGDYDSHVHRNVNIASFFVRLTGFNDLPDSLSLLYHHSRLNLTAMVSLHRLLSPNEFASTERVPITQGLRFQLYIREGKFLKGIFKKFHDRWNLELDALGLIASEAEVSIVLCRGPQNNHYTQNNKLTFQLEEIPEETEIDDNPEPEEVLDMELDGLSSAVDFGIWVMCLGLGLGYLLSTKF